MLICQSILMFIRKNIANVGYPPCTLFYKGILHSFHPKIFILACEYRLLELGELHDGLGLVEEASACSGGQCAWGQPSSSAVARVLQQPEVLGTCTTTGVGEDSSAIPPHGSQSCLNITSSRGLFELVGCWTHFPFQK